MRARRWSGSVLHFVGLAGRYWPLVVIGLYLVGVVVTPAPPGLADGADRHRARRT